MDKVAKNLADRGGVHECEIFEGIKTEAAESEHLWTTCTKNPGHKQFISVQDFVDSHLPKLGDIDARALRKLKGMIDLTVRIRIRWTSRDRPDDDEFAEDRGTDKQRMGTGFINPGVGLSHFDETASFEFNGPCPCLICRGEIWRKHYRFCVQTAWHIVFNTEEARLTKVDLFYDDDASLEDGRMKTVMGVEVLERNVHDDYCVFGCVTHDEEVGRRIQAAFQDQNYSITNPFFPSLLRPWWCLAALFGNIRNWENNSVLVISHPHGQPKKITMGHFATEWLVYNSRIDYKAHTCPGSSGAPVFRDLHLRQEKFTQMAHVHSGTYQKSRFWFVVDGQTNYCHFNAPFKIGITFNYLNYNHV